MNWWGATFSVTGQKVLCNVVNRIWNTTSLCLEKQIVTFGLILSIAIAVQYYDTDSLTASAMLCRKTKCEIDQSGDAPSFTTPDNACQARKLFEMH